MEQEQIDMAYAAGALDGDGSFYITRREEEKSIKWVAGAGIGKSCKHLIEFFIDKFKGNESEKDGHHKWAISCSVRMVPFLEKVSPYLVKKKEQSILLLEWLRKGMPDKEENYLAMKFLNAENRKYLESKCETVSEYPLNWSYLAGLMDTDGSFMIHKRIGHNGMKSPNYIVKVSYGDADSRAINFILKTCPFGTVNKKEYSTIKGGRFVWELVVKDEIVSLIEKILPFLIVKKKNAQIVLDFCKNSKPVKKGHRFGIPSEELAFREKCYMELKVLQRR